MESLWENLHVPIGQLPRVEDVIFQQHPLRYRSLRFTVASMWFGIFFIAFCTASFLHPQMWVLWAGISLGVVSAFAFTTVHMGYKRRSYALRQNDITYKKGWIFFSTTTIPFNRIQHTEVSQGPLERRWQLCTLKIYTAGGSASDLSIPGLEQDEAQQLRDYIARKAATYA